MTTTDTLTRDTDVLIVGAGPTGLALATSLAQAGIACVIVDKLAAGLNTSRAAVIHAHTLEVLEQIGVAGKLVEAGLKLARFSVRDRDRLLLPLRFDRLPSRFPELLMLPQERTEGILSKAFEDAGGTVRRGHEVVDLAVGQDGVLATIMASGERYALRARHVVGADGMHSLVRRIAGIEFEGGGYEESFILADVEMDWPQGRGEVSLFFSPEGVLVIAPLPDDRYRIVATLAGAPRDPDIALVQALLDARGPTRAQSSVTSVLWASRFKLHHRLARHYRHGRLLLVGDAAHVHSPAGGQGMNTGLVDAVVLGRMLAEVVSGRRPDGYLDEYETLRRPAAEQVLHLAGRLTSMAVMKRAPQRFVRNLLLRTLGLLPAFRRKLEMNLSGLSRRRAADPA
ncbi:MAG TPA: FAD-dependent monooxygenase [Burkholderiales bacterium]|nr:FAD-dependent monooxygenase [Burkholderiales bacterium]